MWWALASLCVCACGRIGFDVTTDGGSSSGDGNSGDGSTTDGGTDGCIGALPATTFPGGLPCANWGGAATFTNAGLSESNGTLSITPNVNSAGAVGRCQHDGVTIGAGGAFTEVSGVLAGTSSTTRLEIDWGGVTYYLGASNGTMRAGNTSGLTFTGGNIERWWRFRPNSGQLLFESSPDGAAWRMFASVGGVPTGLAIVRVVAATPMAEAAPGVARFESVNVCP